MKRPRVVLVGASGYGARHLGALIGLHEQDRIELVGLVDSQFEKANPPTDTVSAGFKEFTDLEVALDAVEADAVVIATPPHTHLKLALAVLRRGLGLYLEKPPVPLLQDLDVLEAEARVGQRVEVGFQHTRRNLGVLHQVWSTGRIGDVYRISAHAALARADDYYQRSPWAGKWFLGSVAVLDGPLFNPCAHILHVALLAASMINADWQPGRVSAECYSVRQIDGDDLIAARVEALDRGPAVVATATTAADAIMEPSITLQGTRGEVTVRNRDGEATLRSDGRTSTITPPAEGATALERAVTDPIGDADEFLTLAAVRPYVQVVNAIVQACQTPLSLKEYRQVYRTEGQRFQYMPGVASAIRRVVAEGTLFSDNNEPWSAPAAQADLVGYSRFTHPALVVQPSEERDPEL